MLTKASSSHRPWWPLEALGAWATRPSLEQASSPFHPNRQSSSGLSPPHTRTQPLKVLKMANG